MEHREELWQEFTVSNLPLENGGRAAYLAKDKDRRPEIFTGVVNVWLFRKREEVELLFQRRSKYVDNFGGKYDCSAGGHINYGEDLVSAMLREADEEIGVRLKAEKLNYLCCFCSSTSFRHTFVYDWSEEEDNFKFADHEVEEVKWVPISKLSEFRKEFVKEPLAEDEPQFSFLQKWLREHTE